MMNFEIDTNGIDETAPLIYQWDVTIGGRTHRYVGKAKNGSGRPRRHYARNVGRLLAGKPYRASKPDEWRRVHRVMAEAVRCGGAIRLHLVENCQAADINSRERHWIAALGADLNGGIDR
jgi:hypothetical protein